jgi:hypothetical protein
VKTAVASAHADASSNPFDKLALLGSESLAVNTSELQGTTGAHK